MTAHALTGSALVTRPALPPISITTVVPAIAVVAVVVPSAITAVVSAAASVLISIGGHNAAAQQRHGSGQQHKNGLHKALLFNFRLPSGYALGCRSDVGNGLSYNENFSYNEARA